MGQSGTVDASTTGCEHSPGELRVYVIDDDSDVRRSLHSSLQSAGIVGWPFVGAMDFLEQVDCLDAAPILLDVRMPHIGGLELLARLRELEIEWPVIMMSAHGNIPVAVNSMRLGAVDFLEKPFEFRELEILLRKAHDDLKHNKERALTRRQAQALFATLTNREAEVADLVAVGATNKEIGKKLGISPRTVEIHRANAMAKLGAKSVARVVDLKHASRKT